MVSGVSPAVASNVNGGAAHDHGRKPSVVINASGATGYTPMGGPVGQNARPPIVFGSTDSDIPPPPPAAGVPHDVPSTSRDTHQRDPRVTDHAPSPSPIPQPHASGGRPPLMLQNQSNGMMFGSMGGDAEHMRPHPPPTLGHNMPMHERRASSHSMQSDMSSHSMNRNFLSSNGRGRGGFAPQPPQQSYGISSPATASRQMSNPRAASAHLSGGPQFSAMPPGSPFNRGRHSPAIHPATPNMANIAPQQYLHGNAPMYPNYSHMGAGHHPQGNYQYDPSGGYYQAYWYPGATSQSPRPFPTPYSQPQTGMQPPFHPPPSMSRSTSQASERPSSTGGQPQTPAMQTAAAAPPTSGPQQQGSGSQNFVKPKKESRAVAIKDDKGNAIALPSKPSPPPGASVPPQTPVIVSTPSAPTPPPGAPSGSHGRTESKTTRTAEETKNLFQEQVKRQAEEQRKQEGTAKPASEKPAADANAAKQSVKESIAETEKAAAVDAGDKAGEKAADTAISAAKEDGDKEAPEETEDERMERMIAEMEAQEKEEAERERVFQEKRAKQKEEEAKQDAEKAKVREAELQRQEKEIDALAERRGEAKAGTPAQEPDEQSKELFAKLLKPSLSVGASSVNGTASGAATPASDESSPMPPPSQPASASTFRSTGAPKPKPAHLKLETNKRVEPAEPTPGMQALKTSRFLELREEARYPEGFKSPNPALNVNGTAKARSYDKSFLLQFQSVFKEKPSLDWDQKVKETLGPTDESSSARSGPSRTPSAHMSKSSSSRPNATPAGSFSGPMGNFGGRTLPPGTTSEARFQNSTMNQRPGMGAPAMTRGPSQLGMGAPGAGMSRTNSMQAMSHAGGPNSPRQFSSKGGRGGSKRVMSKKEEADMANQMPLTAHAQIAPLSRSQTGWKPTSIGQNPMGGQHDLSGQMLPDMVQRKVKAALNKMTPEKFDKISDQILGIAGQSKVEKDGRTLRQVIQLTFEKACDEAHWAAMYAQFCYKMLTNMSGEISDETIKDKTGQPVVGGALFRKYLLNRCQEEFERGWQVNLPDKPEGESKEAVLLSDEYYVAAAAKRRGLGLIQFIGQLYKLRMLTLRIMHECVLKLLNFEGDPDEAAVENLTTLLKAVGATMQEDEQGRASLNIYFERIENVIIKSDALGSRPRFMIMDLIDLRKARWHGKDDAKGPKTIQQIHQEADAAIAKQEAERQRSHQRGGPGGRHPTSRGDSRHFSGGMQAPVDYQKTTVATDDLKRLQARGSTRSMPGGNLVPGGSLGGSMLGARSGSRRGANTTAATSSRTTTPPVDARDKKDEASSTNTFGALAALDPSGEGHDTSPPNVRNRSRSPLPTGSAPGPAADKAEEKSAGS